VIIFIVSSRLFGIGKDLHKNDDNEYGYADYFH